MRNKTTHVLFTGPEADTDRFGEEIPVWFVYAADDDSEPTREVSEFHNFESAAAYSHELSKKLRVELTYEGSRA